MHVLYTIANNSSVPYFNWFAARASASNVRFTFVAFHEAAPRMAEEMAPLGFDTHWIRFDAKRRPSGMLGALPRVAALLLRSRPDVVHCHLFDDSVPTLLAARLLRLKVRIVTKQDVGFHWNYRRRYVWFDRLNNANATHLHAVSDATRRFIIEKEGAPASRVHLIRQGCEPETVTVARDEDVRDLRARESLAGRFVVGTVARLIGWKGHGLILEAARQLVVAHPELLFLWAGAGDLGAELHQRIGQAGLSRNVRLLGWVDRGTMPAFYKCLDAYLHPAVGEPFGFAIAEAMMNGVPVAATSCGSTEILRHEQDGYILEPGLAQDVERSIAYLLADVERRRQFAHRARLLALEHLSAERSWQGHLSLYRAALRGRNEPGA